MYSSTDRSVSVGFTPFQDFLGVLCLCGNGLRHSPPCTCLVSVSLLHMGVYNGVAKDSA